MRSIEEGIRSLLPGRGLPLSPWALLSLMVVFLIVGWMAPRSSRAQEPAQQGTAAVAPVSGQAAGTMTADDATMDPESRPLPTYQSPQRPPAPVPASGNLLFEIAGKLALVILVIFACAAGWKMIQVAMPQGAVPATHRPTSPALHVTNTVTLAPQRCLHLVSVGQQRLLLASTPQQIAMLGTVSPELGFSTVRETSVTALPATEAVEELEATDRFESLVSRLTNALAPRTETKPAREMSAEGGFFGIVTENTALAPSEEEPAPERAFPRPKVAEDPAWVTEAEESDTETTADAPGPLNEAPVRGTLFRVAAGSADA